jgi:prophage antirepressor-like protein
MKTFDFAPGITLRVIEKDGEPWFVATDVCHALDMDLAKGAGKWLAGLDKDEISTPEILGVKIPGRGMASALYVNEPGLYSLILKSRKPEAKTFKRWVTHEVLPTIRKTGGYMLPAVAIKVAEDPK